MEQPTDNGIETTATPTIRMEFGAAEQFTYGKETIVAVAIAKGASESETKKWTLLHIKRSNEKDKRPSYILRHPHGETQFIGISRVILALEKFQETIEAKCDPDKTVIYVSPTLGMADRGCIPNLSIEGASQRSTFEWQKLKLIVCICPSDDDSRRPLVRLDRG